MLPGWNSPCGLAHIWCFSLLFLNTCFDPIATTAERHPWFQGAELICREVKDTPLNSTSKNKQYQSQTMSCLKHFPEAPKFINVYIVLTAPKPLMCLDSTHPQLLSNVQQIWSLVLFFILVILREDKGGMSLGIFHKSAVVIVLHQFTHTELRAMYIYFQKTLSTTSFPVYLFYQILLLILPLTLS